MLASENVAASQKPAAAHKHGYSCEYKAFYSLYLKF